MANESTFKIWADETMLTEFGSPTPTGNQTNIHHNGKDSQEFMFFLGSKAVSRKMQTAQNSGNDFIQIQVIDILPERKAEHEYSEGNLIEPELNNGFVYQCITGGISGKDAPNWPIGIGSEVRDGAAVFRNVGAKHATSEVRLALSKVGLDKAEAGAALQLAPELPSGVAVAIYVRVTNGVSDVYNSINTPILAIQTNECVEVAG